ncbi:hypothetical protein ACJ73_02826 [Blastomyces percursus]|uniref:Uncharacterized protein n=1 Tax=Blastomyces percursus TaxID=1658174 RepID=A0A1J9QB87_9EURO|nr:hypothetical protein ACJ73_02826 [Blastomyces percursus]
MPSENHTAIFLTHARVVSFATRHGWESLSTLASYKMFYALADFSLFEQRIADVAQLLHYTFRGDSETSALFETVLAYHAAWNVRRLMSNENFPLFLKDVPSFNTTILTLLCNINPAPLFDIW